MSKPAIRCAELWTNTDQETICGLDIKGGNDIFYVIEKVRGDTPRKVYLSRERSVVMITVKGEVIKTRPTSYEILYGDQFIMLEGVDDLEDKRNLLKRFLALFRGQE